MKRCKRFLHNSGNVTKLLKRWLPTFRDVSMKLKSVKILLCLLRRLQYYLILFCFKESIQTGKKMHRQEWSLFFLSSRKFRNQIQTSLLVVMKKKRSIVCWNSCGERFKRSTETFQLHSDF
jgi:hypothetical protein